MSWKLRLSLVVIAALAAVIWIKLPSQADTDAESSPKQDRISFQSDKVEKYDNEVLRIKPQNFAVSGAVRDMPTIDPDALVKGMSFVAPEERREKAVTTKERANRFFTEDEDKEEFNELNAEALKKVIPGAGAASGRFEDPLSKKSLGAYGPESPQTMPTPSLTFNGATQSDNFALGFGSPSTGGAVPPDTNGDVGPNHYVSSVNLVLKMFNKSGAVVAGPIKTSSLFASLPANDPCRTSDDGDPIVLYDSLADRWHVSQFAAPFDSESASIGVDYQCVALSVTGDPTGAYYVWSYAYQSNLFNDYPKVGVWTDAYHMTFNQFSTINGAFLGLGFLSQDRAKALVGDPTASAVYVNVGGLIAPGSGGALPGDIDGFVAPPAGMAEVIGEFRADEIGDPVDGIRMFKWVPNFSNPVNSSLTILGDLQLAPFDARRPSGTSHIEQLGGANLNATAERSMHRFAYRNFGTTANPINSYVGNFSVNVSGVNPTTAATYQTGIRWFEARRTGDSFSVFDQGTHNLTPGNGASGLNNWMGSIAQDNAGNIALGFSQAGTTQRADIKIAGRTNNVQNSGTLNEGEALMHAATGSQVAGTSTTGSRWGDYSAMTVDPTDDCTFWYTQEYYATVSSNLWLTRVGKFRFPQCTDAPKGIIQGTVTNCATGAVINGASINATGGFNRVSNTSGAFSLTASPATYNVTATKAGFLASALLSVTVGNGQTQTVDFCLNPTSVFAASGNPQIVSESCGVANGTPDPGEQITVSLPLQNNGAAAVSNLTAALQTGGGVTSPSGTQNFGAVAANGGTSTRNFTFTVDPTLGCGSTVTLTFNISDGTTNLGTVTRTYTTGLQQQSFSENFDGVTAPALPAGWTKVQLSGTGIDWVTQTTTPNSPPNNAFANDAGVKSTTALVSPPVQIQTADAQLSFKNFFDTELYFDGMVLEYSTDNGSNWSDVTSNGGSFVSGGYNALIISSGSATASSTLTGRLAWSGKSLVYENVLVNLPASLNGQTVKFRWVMATDVDTATVGVRIDDVKIFGSRQCSTGCSSVAPCQTRSRNNFDSDNKADISVYRPESGTWFLQNSQSGFTSVQFGLSTDKIVPADYDGDGKTDIAVYRGGTWYIQRSQLGFTAIQFGLPDDIPLPADFDSDCKADLAVWRPSSGTWFVLNGTTGQYTSQQWGVSTDKPVVGDYDGDGKADYAVYRPSNGTWYLLRSRDGFAGVQWGLSTDKPVVGDYDGDGKADTAVYRPSNGTWYILRSRDGFASAQFGESTDLPVPSDYDGDGKTDYAVYRPSSGNWFLLKSTEGFASVKFGEPTDRPIPNAFVP